MKYKVQDHPGLVRDSRSNAIINIDEKSYKEYRSRKLMQSKVSELDSEIKDIKNSVEEIKSLLTQIIKRTN